MRIIVYFNQKEITMTPNEHIPGQMLIDYALKDEFYIPEEKVKIVRAHISECEFCRKQYEIFIDRYHDFTTICDPVQHFNKLQSIVGKQRHRRKMWYGSVAAALLIMISYGITVRFMNNQFDHSEIGLAAFYEDYRYAQTPVTFRDSQTVESPDSRLFRQAVFTLFDAKTTTLGLFPDYDAERVLEAERLFAQAEAETINLRLKEKIMAYRDKIRVILAKKEIKK